MNPMKTYTVKVTATDIKRGCAANIKTCPIARALSRALKAAVNVGMGYWSFAEAGTRCCDRRLPNSAAEFIAAFDGQKFGQPDIHGRIKPFAFTVTV